jgi:prophage regulatory protein
MRSKLPDTPIDPLAYPDRLLGVQVVMHVTAASRASIYSWMQAGAFPKPRKLGNRRVAWLARDIQTWINSRPLAA